MSDTACIRLPASGRMAERLVGWGLWAVAILVALSLSCIVGYLLWHGAGQVSLSFLLDSPRHAGRAGGIYPIVVSTLMLVGVAIAASVPLGLCCAVWISEFTRRGGWLSTLLGRSLDMLAAVPSIVFGLFGNALFCNLLDMGYSILAGGLTLGCMLLPILIRATEASLRSVPDDYRVAALALGISRTRASLSILLPSAAAGMAVGVVLGIGRAMAETAALLFTSGYVDRLPRGVMDSGRALSVHIYDLSMNISGGEPNACASALILIAMLFALNLLARWIVRRSFPLAEGA